MTKRRMSELIRLENPVTDQEEYFLSGYKYADRGGLLIDMLNAIEFEEEADPPSEEEFKCLVGGYAMGQSDLESKITGFNYNGSGDTGQLH